MLHVAGSAALAATFNVNSTLDQPDDDEIDGICHTSANTCTLRAAVMQANFLSEETLILLPAGTFTLTRPPTASNGAESGDLNLDAFPAFFINLVGAGAESTIIDGGCLDRVFRVEGACLASFRSLTVRNGCAANGGGILVLGVASLEHVTVRDNRAIQGGGVSAEGSHLFMTASTIRDNRATGPGGGLFGSRTLEIASSTISGNVALVDGGGMYLAALADLHLSESTISSNSVDDSGGAIFVRDQATVNIYSSTIVFNRADADDDGLGDGGGIVNDVSGNNTVNVRNCLIAGNYLVASLENPDDCVGTIGSYGRNLFGDTAGCSVVTGSGSWGLLNDIGWIGPLAKNGGPTRTHQLFPGSNAIDGGDPANGCLSPTGSFAVDQRGVPRVNGVRCDVGAYEAGILFTDGFELGDLSAWSN